MTLNELFTTLKEKFADKVLEVTTPEKGDGYILVDSQALKDIGLFLKFEETLLFNILHCISSLDCQDTLAVVYHLYSSTHPHQAILKTQVPRNQPIVASVVDVWAGANWHEREAYDMMGIVFDGHPDLRRILCPEDWEGFPLRKDYQVQERWHGMHVPYVERASATDGHVVIGKGKQ